MNFWIMFAAVAAAEVALYFLKVFIRMAIVCWRDAKVRKKSKNKVEKISCVIEIFEDFLHERGIDISNPEKCETDHPAIIYGSDFGELYDQLEREFRCNSWIK